MAGKRKINVDNLNGIAEQQEQASVNAEKKELNKKSNSDYLRLDLRPQGDDLKSYVDNKAAKLSLERGKKISTTVVIQELIKEDREKSKGLANKKQTKRDKVATFLENIDDKKLSALITLLDIQF